VLLGLPAERSCKDRVKVESLLNFVRARSCFFLSEAALLLTGSEGPLEDGRTRARAVAFVRSNNRRERQLKA